MTAALPAEGLGANLVILARGWTVETLAREAGLSRSTFAATFKARRG